MDEIIWPQIISFLLGTIAHCLDLRMANRPDTNQALEVLIYRTLSNRLSVGEVFSADKFSGFSSEFSAGDYL